MSDDVTARVCVKVQEDGSFQTNYEGVSTLIAFEILGRLLQELRGTRNFLEQLDFFPFTDGEVRKICIAFNKDDYRIQCSVVGMEPLEASAFVALAHTYLGSLLLGLLEG